MAQPPLSQFVQFVSDELQALRVEKRTGTLFVISSDSHLAQFGLKSGEIVALVFQNKHGLEALEILESFRHQQVRANTFRFTNGHLPPSKLPLPPTDHILDLLLGKSPRSQSAGDPKSARMTDQTKAIVEQELVEFIGPIAAIVCDEVWNSLGSLDAILDALSQELSDSNQAALFRQNVLKRLV
ncbi:MAG: hypothetical protein ABTR54_10635 [Candidatus Competibacter sp.]|nr:hypothetical protein [Candidatus Competibacter sp.]